TIKVLGFYENETAKYVFREITMLSAGGSFVGLFMGKALHAFVMAQVQVDNMFFPVQIQPVSYLASVILTMFFSWLITRFMKPRLDKIDMAESLKSIE
ncbi:MAG: ABC transporter permease, partial [Firmicutes bacterium]|nr:ABC transporter permease [Bacillota bacterium]